MTMWGFKFTAAQCRNFKGSTVMGLEEDKIVHICTTPYCQDRANCDETVKEDIPKVNFELKPKRLQEPIDFRSKGAELWVA